MHPSTALQRRIDDVRDGKSAGPGERLEDADRQVFAYQIWQELGLSNCLDWALIRKDGKAHSFVLTTPVGMADVGDDLMSQTRIRNALAEQLGFDLPRVTPKAWLPYSYALRQLAREPWEAPSVLGRFWETPELPP